MLIDLLLKIPYLQYAGYLIVFVAALLEALPAAGLFVPGQTIVLLAGFLAQQGVLSIQLVLVLAIAGAIIGDFAGYYAGRRYGLSLVRNRAGIVKDVSALLREHPVKTLILGRFNSITRAFAPFAAGASGVRLRQFALANVIGGVLWGSAFTLLGYVFGASYSLAAQAMDTVLLVAVVVFSGVLLAYYYLKKHAGVSGRASVLLLMNILGILVFAAVTQNVMNGGSLIAIDHAVHESLRAYHTTAIDAVAIAFTNVLQLVVVSVLSAVLFLIIWRHSRRNAVLFAGIMISGLVLDRLLKELFMRLRPLDGLLSIDSYGYPSGHAMLSTLLLGAFVLSFHGFTKWKQAITAIAAVLVVIVAFSRLYVGVHWLSDAISGIAFGVFWLSFVFLCDELYESYKKDRARRFERVSARSS